MLSTLFAVAVIGIPQREVVFVPLLPTKIYVSPTGDDRNPGDTASKPLATPRAALDTSRRLLDPKSPGQATRLVFAPGTYVLGEPLVLTPADSGFDAVPVVLAAEGGSVTFSGGRKPGAWRDAELNGKKVWAADAPAEWKAAAAAVPKDALPSFKFRELYINGQRRTLARFPNTGFLRMQDVPDQPQASQWNVGLSWFRYKEEDAAAWKGVKPGTEIVTFMRWIDDHRVIASVDAEKRMVRTTRPGVFLNDPGDLYFLENAVEFLDAPGEWWFDRASGTIYYAPLPGEKPETSEAVVPVLEELVRIEGQPEKGVTVHDIVFNGITFAHAQWWFDEAKGIPGMPDNVRGFQQAAWGVPGAVRVIGGERIEFNGCTVEHVGGYGVEIGKGSKRCRVRQSTVRDLGAGGIKIGDTGIYDKESERSSGNEVSDCVIENGCHLQHQAIGLWIGQSSGNLIAHNRISDFDYSGISIGWTWGYGASHAGGNIVEFNDVGRLGARPGNTEPPLGDMAGIYTLGTQEGTAIRDNYFHDIAGRTIAWGIYFDEGSTGIVAERNLVFRTTHGGFHQHYGKENRLRNNIFAYGRDAQLWKTRKEEHNTFDFVLNIVLADNDKLLAGDWSGKDYTMKDNTFWREGVPGGAVVFPGDQTLAQWQQAGHDSGSFIADPGFTDPQKGDFTPAKGSMFAGTKGMPFDRSQVGPRK